MFVQWDQIPGPLPPGAAFLETNTVRLPIIESGNYFLLFQSDAQNDVYESNENNNVLAVPFTFNAQPPDLTPVALQAPPTVTSIPYPTINVVWGVLNQGLGEALPYPDFLWLDQLFLSTSNSPDGGTLLGSYPELGPVPPGGTYWRSNSVQLPVTQSGLNYLVFKANANNTVLESTTNNNTFIVPITLTITPPDLAPVAFEAPSAVTAPPYPIVAMVWGITNQGTGPAIGSPAWSDELFISTKPTFDYSATSVSFFNEFGPVAPGTAYWRTNMVTVPVTSSGTYYLFLVADVNDLLHDGARGNNMAIAQVIFNIQPPDLTPSAFVVPSVVSGPPNPKMLFSWMVTNIGSGAALRQWSDQLFFSTHSNLDWTATSLLTSYEGYPPVPPGGSYQRTRTATVPVTQSGQYYFFFQTDTANSLYESNTANNIVVAPVAFHIDPPDLSPILLQAPAAIAGSLNPTITLTYAVTNQGVGAAVGLDYPYRWYDQLFVSTNSVLDGSEILVGNYYDWSESGPIAPGSAYWRTRTVQLPLKASGNYFLLLHVNASQTLFESSLSNNVLAVPIAVSLQLPDLAPLALVAPSLVSGPPYPTMTLVWGITNQGSGEAPSFSSWPYGWVDVVYLSTNTNLDWPGTWLASTVENGPLASGTNYWRTNVVTLPITNSGAFFLVLRTDDGGSVPEVDENNNTLVMPITFQATGLPDLVPLAMQAPPVLTNYALVSLVTVVTNEGSGTAQASPPGGWQDNIFISQSPAVDSTARFVTAQYESGPLPQGATYRRTNYFYLPPLQDGDSFFIFQVNGNQGLAESNLGNNTLAVPFSFHLVPPDLAPVALQAPAVVDASPFPTITVIWGITNQGPGLAVANGWSWYDSLYISTNSDTTGVIAYGSSWSETNSVPAGESYWRTNTVQLPITTSGNYYLVFETDSGNYLQETNLANNIKARPITFNIHQPDLAPVLAQVPAEVTGPANPFINVIWAVTNSGTGTAGSYQGWIDSLFISTNNVLDSSATLVWGESETNAVPAGGLYWHTNKVSLPVFQTGTYYLFFVANNNEWLAESDYSNNVLMRTLNVTIQPPDLAPLALIVPDTVTGAPWPNVTVVVGVTNRGIGTAPAFPGWQDGLYLSAYPFLDDSSYPFFTWSQTNAVPPGSIYWITNTVRMPVVDSATLYLIFKADAFGQLDESDESNNSMVAAITFDLSPTPNLVALELLAPPIVSGSQAPTITLAWRVANQGLGPTAGQWFDRIYLSPYPNINWNPQPLLSALITNSLAPGADYWHTNSVTLRNVYNGTYFFVLTANSDGGLFETDTADNFLSVPVQIDLTIPPAAPMIAGGRFLTNGTVQLEVYGPIGSQFTLQASTNLLSWVVISNFTMVAAPTYVVDPQASSFQQRFYRLALVIPPRLSISRTATSVVVLSWPLPADGWVLEQASSLVGSPHGWTQIPPPYPTDTKQVWVTITNSEDISFYRLRLP
jgi:subtilase family serine protease